MRREHELRVVGDAADVDVEAVLDVLGIHEQRRAAAPAAQQAGLLAPVVAIHAQHPAVASAVDHVRAVEARGADVASACRCSSPRERRAERVGGILDDEQVARCARSRRCGPSRAGCRSATGSSSPRVVRRDRRLDPIDVDVERVASRRRRTTGSSPRCTSGATVVANVRAGRDDLGAAQAGPAARRRDSSRSIPS